MHKYSASMVDGKIVRLSVSQLSRFDTREKGGCPRKWYYRYVSKIPDPPRKAQQEGIDGHKRWENYYKGQAVVWMDMDLPAVAEMPKPGPGVQSEVSLDKLTCLRIPFQGSIDLVEGTNTAYDFKYQSRIKVYQEPTAQLWGYLEELKARDEAKSEFYHFKHVYISKSPPYKVKIVSQSFSPREVERNWLSYGSLVKEMQDVAAEPDVEKVPCNTGACYAYGPCAYLSICSRGRKIETDMGFMDELKALRSETAAVSLPEVRAEIASPENKLTNDELVRPDSVAGGSQPSSTGACDGPYYKVLPPDAPRADAVPEPEPEKHKKQRKLKVKDAATSDTVTQINGPNMAATEPVKGSVVVHGPSGNQGQATIGTTGETMDEIPDSSPSWAPKVSATTKFKGLRLGIKLGMPEYSSIEAAVEMEGPDEEALAKSIENAIMRRLEKLVPKFYESLALRNAKK